VRLPGFGKTAANWLTCGKFGWIGLAQTILGQCVGERITVRVLDTDSVGGVQLADGADLRIARLDGIAWRMTR